MSNSQLSEIIRIFPMGQMVTFKVHVIKRLSGDALGVNQLFTAVKGRSGVRQRRSPGVTGLEGFVAK